MKALVRAAALAGASLAASAAPAGADIIVTPYLGQTFAAQTTFLLANVDDGTWVAGGSAAWLSDGIIGVEADFAYAPGFFGSIRSINFETSQGGDVVSLTGNLLLTMPVSVTRESLRPYISGGMGMLHAGVNDLAGVNTIDQNLLAISIGGGAIGFLNNRTGVRFDLRHIRTTRRDVDNTTFQTGPQLGFWRATVGVALRY